MRGNSSTRREFWGESFRRPGRRRFDRRWLATMAPQPAKTLARNRQSRPAWRTRREFGAAGSHAWRDHLVSRL